MVASRVGKGGHTTRSRGAQQEPRKDEIAGSDVARQPCRGESQGWDEHQIVEMWTFRPWAR